MTPIAPDFVIAGFPKTASTTLAARLGTHPQICFSAPKEPNTYLQIERPGLVKADSTTLFAHAEEGQVLGEGSVRYGMTHEYPDTPGILHAAAPDSRLIFLIREPSARALSHWRMLQSEAPDLPDPETCLSHRWAYDALITTGLYRLHLERYLEYFDQNQLLVIDFVDLTERYEPTLEKILSFISPSLRPYEMDHQISANVTGENRSRPTKLLGVARNIPLWHTATRLVPSELRNQIRRTLLRPPAKPEISNNFLEQVQDACGDDYHWAQQFAEESS